MSIMVLLTPILSKVIVTEVMSFFPSYEKTLHTEHFHFILITDFNSFIQQVFIECPLCARYHSRHLVTSVKKKISKDPYPCGD